jgi:hypothetical protein
VRHMDNPHLRAGTLPARSMEPVSSTQPFRDDDTTYASTTLFIG